MGKVIILSGKNNREDKISYIVSKVRGTRVFGVVPDVVDYKDYVGNGWELRVGLTVRDLDKVNVHRRDNIVVEPYDVSEFNHYLRDSKILWEVLESENITMYVILGEHIKLKLSDRVEKVQCGKEVNKGNGKFYKTILEVRK